MGRAFEVRKNAMAKTGQKLKFILNTAKKFTYVRKMVVPIQTPTFHFAAQWKRRRRPSTSHVIEKAIDKAAGGVAKTSSLCVMKVLAGQPYGNC